MEIVSENPSHRRFRYDAVESDWGVKGLENVWSTSFSHKAEPKLGSSYMSEMVGSHGSSTVSIFRDVAERLDGLYKPAGVSTDLQTLSCQPYDGRISKLPTKMRTDYGVKIEEGYSFNEDIVPPSASMFVINHGPQVSSKQTYLAPANNALIPPSSIDKSLLQDIFVNHGHRGELTFPYGETASEEGDIVQPQTKSSVESASFTLDFALDSSESSASNELLCSSEMQMTGKFFDQSKMIEYPMYALDPMLEDPFANMAIIQSYTNDGCALDQTPELASGNEKSETFTQVYEGLKAAHPERFPGYCESIQGDNIITLRLEEASDDLSHPRIDFEESFVQSHTLPTLEGSKVLTEDSSVTCEGTQFRLPRPISGLYSHHDMNKCKLYGGNKGGNTGMAIQTVISEGLFDTYKNKRKQLNDMQESSVVQSCCSFASQRSAVLNSRNEDRMDDCLRKITDLGPIAKKVCRQPYDRCMKNDRTEIGSVHLLTAGAEAVARRDACLASVILNRLKNMVSCSSSSMQRVLAYFVQSLEHLSKSVKKVDHPGGRSAVSLGEQIAAFQILHEIFPYIKFGHFTANQAILEAVQGSKRVHIVDFEILEGIQWPAFMQALVSRNGAPPVLHITAVCGPEAECGSVMVHKTCKRLKEFAGSIGLSFTYSLLTIDDSGERFDAGQIEMVEGEALAVNCMVHLPHMPRHNMARITSFLQAVRSISPAIVTLVEEELGCSTTAAASYLSEALYHFKAICDSLEACLPLQAEARMLVERVFLESSIQSTISMWDQTMSPCALYGGDGSNKYKWSTLMYASGFKPIPLSFHNQSQARLLLGLHKDGFELEERGHQLVLGWHVKPLYAASVWK